MVVRLSYLYDIDFFTVEKAFVCWNVSHLLAMKKDVLPMNLGVVSIRKTVLPGMAIPMLKIRRPNGRLIFNMEIAIRR